MSCPRDGLRTKKHNVSRDILDQQFQSSGLRTRKEQFGLVDQKWQRPADIRVHDYRLGRDALVDVTVVNPFAHRHAVHGLKAFAAAVNNAEDDKIDGCGATAEAIGVSYILLLFLH